MELPARELAKVNFLKWKYFDIGGGSTLKTKKKNTEGKKKEEEPL